MPDRTRKFGGAARTATSVLCLVVFSGWLAAPETLRAGRNLAAEYLRLRAEADVTTFSIPAVPSSKAIAPADSSDLTVAVVLTVLLLVVGIGAPGPADLVRRVRRMALGIVVRRRGLTFGFPHQSALFLLSLGLFLGWMTAPDFVREQEGSIAGLRADVPERSSTAPLMQRFATWLGSAEALRSPATTDPDEEHVLEEGETIEEPALDPLASFPSKRLKTARRSRPAVLASENRRTAPSETSPAPDPAIRVTSYAAPMGLAAGAVFTTARGSGANGDGSGGTALAGNDRVGERDAGPDSKGPDGDDGDSAEPPSSGGPRDPSDGRNAAAPFVELPPAPGDLLVALSGDATPTVAEAFIASLGGVIEECFTVVDYCLVRFPAVLDVATLANDLKASGIVRDAVPNYVRGLAQASGANDVLYPLQSALDRIDAANAWEALSANRSAVPVTIAILDTGFDLTHVDLSQVYGATINTTLPAGGTTSVLTGNPDHGTKVAGILAALGDNLHGIAGVNKSWANLFLAQVFPPGTGDRPLGAEDDDIIRAIASLPPGTRVANMSFAGADFNPALCTAMANRPDVLFVAAAGNAGTNREMYPAACSGGNVLAVAASGSSDDDLTDVSSRGSGWVDIAAPGASVLTTIPGSLYGFASGTSMAAPHVAGAAALLFAQSSSLTPLQVASRLLARSDWVSSYTGNVASGRLNACRALRNLAGDCD